ncbi:hypothetical protein B0T26DRAFT_633002 [Lasiosphaeria miniovina]|uniref:Arrestin C-terminal-like domain-containing protein n=1 Tax=Lasiosphaeria miniovina TaxID=1954250 RepID=A0AA40BH02_9PEZI|nr:uncharacterized protein B0T26DRAFT_633002 [Lasiosphaeria miniovina]KAK0734051.1 hypothetical protein B0T26DRAFT_633002 [Lasiosphaeria miniovina]
MGPNPKTVDNSAAASASAFASAQVSTSASLEETSTTRSLLSRFGLLPLRARARNVADFHIRPAEPHRKYGAGDHVQGAVILTVVKPVRITHLTVALHGYVRVYKNPNGSANDPVINPAEAPAAARHGTRLKYLGNGYASLFQDEQVLSSDGRLEPGRYEFNFDLLFPSKGLPSSIDRGTISYMITATLTRPTSISPTASCERKVYLVEKVDIGLLTPPRARTIYLEPISKKAKKKKQVASGADRTSVASDLLEPASDLDSTRANENSTEGSLSVVGEDLGHDSLGINPRSPIQSDIRSVSGDSAASGSTGRTRGGEVNPAGVSSASVGGKPIPSIKDRTITATIELLRGGCLAGDLVPVKISVQHIRRIKSMHGVIVTLYRQGRIDSDPPMPLFGELSNDDAKRVEKEDYYPKSKTGLGGLSLSSAGSCSVFRKDLSQAFTPLIIDPDTLTASVTTSVRIPEDVFPTIKNVPGEMIAFKYQIEVIVDLGGKLAKQIHLGKPVGPRIGNVGAPLGMSPSPYEGGTPSLASFGTSIIDTDRLRREKGVISVVFEVVVGTSDSSRLHGKGLLKAARSIRTLPVLESDLYNGSHGEKRGWPNSLENEGYDTEDHGHHRYPQEPVSPPHLPQQYPYWNPAPSETISAPHYIPPPDIPEESNLTEKERVRRAEQRLLPSQPSEPLVAGPSTAVFPEGENIYDADSPRLSIPRLATTTSHAEYPDHLEAPTAPTLEELSSGPQAASSEDKQELERQRLLAEASVPPEFPEDYDNGGGAVAGPSAPASMGTNAIPATFEPSAPTAVDEETHYGFNYSYGSAAPSSSRHTPSAPHEPLPKYER